MEQSPNELRVPQPGRRGMSKRPMYIVLGVTLALIGALFYAIEQADKRNARMEAESKKPQVDELALVQGQGQGVIFPPPPAAALVEGVRAEEQPKKPLVVVMREQEPDQEADALRKRKELQYLAALSSPMVKQGGGSAGSSSAAAAPAGAGSGQTAATLPGQPSQN